MELAVKPICILGALWWETAPIRWGLRLEKIRGKELRVFEGMVGGRKVLVVPTGMGGQEAARAAEITIRQWDPLALIGIGFAGALNPEVRPGTLVLANRILGQGVENPEGISAPGILLKLAESCAAELGLTYRAGTIVTAHRLVSTLQDKTRLGQANSALAVDMESGYLAQLAWKASVPFLAARFIADALDTGLPDTAALTSQFFFRLLSPRNLAKLPGLAAQWVKAMRTYLLFLPLLLALLPDGPCLAPSRQDGLGT